MLSLIFILFLLFELISSEKLKSNDTYYFGAQGLNGQFYSSDGAVMSEATPSKGDLESQLLSLYGDVTKGHTGFGKTVYLSAWQSGSRYGCVSRPDFEWKTAHAICQNCKLRVSKEILSSTGFDACHGKFEYTKTATYQKTYAMTHGWKVTLKTNEITSNFIGVEASVEASGSYTQTTANTDSTSEKWIFEEKGIYIPYSYTLEWVCEGSFLEDTTEFSPDGSTYHSQGRGAWTFDDEHDHECELSAGVYSDFEFDSWCKNIKTAKKCTDTRYGIVTQKVGDGKKWWGIKGGELENFAQKGDIIIPIVDSSNVGIGIVGFKKLDCPTTR